MKVSISFKHLDHTPALDERIMEKSKRLEKYFEGKSDCKWICFVKSGIHYAEISLRGPHYDYFAVGTSDSLYKSLDLALEKIERQICKRKEKIKNKIHRDKKQEGLVCLDPENAWTDYEEESEGYAENFYKKVL